MEGIHAFLCEMKCQSHLILSHFIYLVWFCDGLVVAVESPVEWCRREVHDQPDRDEGGVENHAERDLAIAVHAGHS